MIRPKWEKDSFLWRNGAESCPFELKRKQSGFGDPAFLRTDIHQNDVWPHPFDAMPGYDVILPAA